MPSEHKLVEAAQHATGDAGIDAAGLFHPRGLAGKIVLGAGVVGTIGDTVGAGAAGAGAGAAAVAGSEKGAILVAVSPTHVYVLHAPSGLATLQLDEVTEMHRFDRSHLDVDIKARVTVRVIVLSDTQSDDRIELESARNLWTHGKDVARALLEDLPAVDPSAPG